MSHSDIGFVNILVLFILVSCIRPLVVVVNLHDVLVRVAVHHCVIILGTHANVVIALCILMYC